MRFCLVSTQEHWGGGEALLVSIGSELLRQGHSVSSIVRSGGVVEQQIVKAGVTVLHGTRKRGSNLSDWLSIRRALRQWCPDIVVLNDSHAVPLAGSAVWCCRHPRPVRLAMKHTIFRLHSPLKYRLLSDKLICVSQAALETVLDGGLPPKHAVVIHGGCQPVATDPNSRHSVRTEFGISAEQFLIVAVGSLLDVKGHRDLIDAVAQLSNSHPNLVVLIVGEGTERGKLQKQIAQHGLASRVFLLGYRTDAQQLLDAADLVVHPSHAEGLSLVLIQAQMLSRPIVATAVGGTKEVLAVGTPHCSCWLAQPQDPNSLASSVAAAYAALERPASDLEQKLAHTAARMCEEFTVQATTRQLIELAANRLLGSGTK